MHRVTSQTTTPRLPTAFTRTSTLNTPQPSTSVPPTTTNVPSTQQPTTPAPPTHTVTQVLVVEPSDIIEKEVVIGTTTTTSAIATAGSTVASPAAALQVSRALAVFALSRCSFDHEAKLSFPESTWPGFQWGVVSKGRFYRGAVVANLTSLVILLALGFGCVALLRQVKLSRYQKDVTLINEDIAAKEAAPDGTLGQKATVSAFALLRYPGAMLVFVGLILDGTVMASIALMNHGAGVGDAVVGGFTLFLILAAITACIGSLFLPHSKEVVFDAQAHTSVYNTLRQFLFGAGKWEAKTPEGAIVLQRYGMGFIRYHGGARWFFIAELILTLAISCMKGVMPSDVDVCRGLMIGITCVNFVGLVLVVGVRPYVAAAKNILAILISLLTFASSLVVVVGQQIESSRAMKGGEAAALAASYLAIVSIFISLARVVDERRRRWLKATQPKEEVDDKTQHLLDDSSSGDCGDKMHHQSLMDRLDQNDLEGLTKLDAHKELEEQQAQQKRQTPPPVDPQLYFEDDDEEEMEEEPTHLQTNTANRAFTHNGPRSIYRSEEGQQLYEDVEVMLNKGLRKKNSVQLNDDEDDPLLMDLLGAAPNTLSIPPSSPVVAASPQPASARFNPEDLL